MRLSALIDLPVKSSQGERLGRVREIHAVDGMVTELVYGAGGVVERLTGKAARTVVPWERVARITAKAIVLHE